MSGILDSTLQIPDSFSEEPWFQIPILVAFEIP